MCLFLVGQPQVAHRLGLGAPTSTARNKLISALPQALADEADRLSSWLLHDPDPWTGNRIPHGELRRLARMVREQRQAELTIASDRHCQARRLGTQGRFMASHRLWSQGGRSHVHRRVAGNEAHHPAIHPSMRLRPRHVLETAHRLTQARCDSRTSVVGSGRRGIHMFAAAAESDHAADEHCGSGDGHHDRTR